MLIVCGSTHIGMVRSINQDAMEIIKLNDNCVFAVVCDGMGGVNGGDIASNAAVTLFSERIRNGKRDNSDKNSIKSLLLTAFDAANARIKHMARDDISLEGMGTTAVAVYIEPPLAHIINVGDSRAYIIRDVAEQITTDHSVVQELVDRGKITKLQARNHPKKNVITRVLGGTHCEPDYFMVEINDGDIILLCTDGLTNHVEDQEIAFEAMSDSIESLHERLINMANAYGGSDNITVAVIKYQADK